MQAGITVLGRYWLVSRVGRGAEKWMSSSWGNGFEGFREKKRDNNVRPIAKPDFRCTCIFQ